jgi:hypothetical protein
LEYLNKSFSVVAGGSRISDSEWERIFGSEKERKKKLSKAIMDQEAHPRPPQPRRCGGGTGDPEVIPT